MSKPSIFCNKKEAGVGEEITLVGHQYDGDTNNRWQFNNVLSTDIELIPPSILTDNEITFKCMKAIEPLIVQYNNPNNPILNSHDWNMNGSSLYYWSLSGTGSESPSGWVVNPDGYINFNGDYYRVVNGSAVGTTALYQPMADVGTGLYKFKIRYKSTNALTIDIDGNNRIVLPSTDVLNASPIYPITHEIGTFKFNIENNISKIELLFYDEVTNNTSGEYDVIQGNTYLTTSDFTDMDLTLTGGCVITSELSDIPEGLSSLNIANNNVSGYLSKITTIKNSLNFANNESIRGDIVDLTSDTLSGVVLNNTNVAGHVYLDDDDELVYNGKLFNWNLDDTLLTMDNFRTTIEYITAFNITHGVLSGTFICNDHNIEIITNPDPDEVIENTKTEGTYKNVKLLREYGWTVDVTMPTNNPWDTSFQATSGDMETYYGGDFWDTM